ncbi:unnamed protein product [Amoebophrya sp. A120]|nr:unnamed protein product [Amoebophrya sp. A120]|eukprot:GSA120T00006521001.1
MKMGVYNKFRQVVTTLLLATGSLFPAAAPAEVCAVLLGGPAKRHNRTSRSRRRSASLPAAFPPAPFALDNANEEEGDNANEEEGIFPLLVERVCQATQPKNPSNMHKSMRETDDSQEQQPDTSDRRTFTPSTLCPDDDRGTDSESEGDGSASRLEDFQMGQAFDMNLSSPAPHGGKGDVEQEERVSSALQEKRSEHADELEQASFWVPVPNIGSCSRKRSRSGTYNRADLLHSCLQRQADHVEKKLAMHPIFTDKTKTVPRHRHAAPAARMYVVVEPNRDHDQPNTPPCSDGEEDEEWGIFQLDEDRPKQDLSGSDSETIDVPFPAL